MTIEVYPVAFEGYEDGEAVFKVKAFDEATAEVSIDTVVNAASWKEISNHIRECLLKMKLDGDEVESEEDAPIRLFPL